MTCVYDLYAARLFGLADRLDRRAFRLGMAALAMSGTAQRRAMGRRRKLLARRDRIHTYLGM